MARAFYLDYYIVLMKILGTISIESESRAKIWFFRCWRSVQGLVFSYVAVGAFLSLKHTDDFVLRIQSILYIGLGVSCLCRMGYFIISEKQCLDLIEEMQAFFKWKTNTGLEEKSLENRVMLVRRLALFSMIVFSINGQCTILLPVLFIKSSERMFPMPMWFPDFCKDSPYYEMALFFQIYVMELFVVITIALDQFFVATIILTCYQFDMLGWECKCLFHKAFSKSETNFRMILITGENDSSQTSTPVSDAHHPDDLLISRQIEKCLLKDLGQLIAFHQSLIKFCHKFDALYSPMIVWYIFMVMVSVVFVLFVITQANDLMATLIFIPYVIVGTTFVFLLCFFGNLLTTQSEQLFDDLYDSSWYMCKENFKTCFKLLQFRAGKPMVLTLGKFGILSLNVFLSCAKTAVSYVAVLQQLSEQN